ncbi:ferrochelatase [Desulfogranum japonicum]|uniref:ferrochelatase n=1 Tax=Desulfogranum japonicum TaxID=231447 RepID=UPI000423285B|nr:ferrochelatase [Desulfogranum japonicum]
MKIRNQKTGVLLLNLGGPEKTEDIRPFLFNLFSDRSIIRLGPCFLQKPIAWWIAKKRAPKSAASYAHMGGGSPIRRITDQQASALETQLGAHGSFLVRSCMRYWHPYAMETLQELRDEGVDKIIALPLYPHYSVATTGSSLADVRDCLNRLSWSVPLHVIRQWPDQTAYIDSLVTKIRQGVKHFNGEPVQILYSAHSLPVRFIEEGDPYVDHLQITIKALEKQTERKGILCYQSRSGPVEWLGPSTKETLENLARKNMKNVLVVPISFVSDHVETLVELDIEYRELAEGLGMHFVTTSGLNTDPQFITALKKLVLSAAA